MTREERETRRDAVWDTAFASYMAVHADRIIKTCGICAGTGIRTDDTGRETPDSVLELVTHRACTAATIAVKAWDEVTKEHP